MMVGGDHDDVIAGKPAPTGGELWGNVSKLYKGWIFQAVLELVQG